MTNSPSNIDSYAEALLQQHVDVNTEMDDGVLIELVAQYPILYDMQVKDYKNNVLKESTWEFIGSIMQQPASECMKRWSCLKDSFRREKKKRDLETRSGSGLAKRKGFAMYNHLRFLDCHIKKRRCYTNASRTNTSNFALTIPSSHNASTLRSITEGFTAPTRSNMDLLLPIITPVVLSSDLTYSSHPRTSASPLDYNTPFIFGKESAQLLNMTSLTQPATAVASSKNIATLSSTKAAAPSSSSNAYQPTLISSSITSMALVNATTSTTSDVTLNQHSNQSEFKLPLTIPTPFLTRPTPPLTAPTPPPTTLTQPPTTPTPPLTTPTLPLTTPTTPTPPPTTPTPPPTTPTPPPTTPTLPLTTPTLPLTTPTTPTPPPTTPTPPPTTPTLPLTTPTLPLTTPTTPTPPPTTPTPPPSTPTPPSYYSQALRAPAPSAPTNGCQSFLPPSPSISTSSSSAPMSPIYSPYSYLDMSSPLSDFYADDSQSVHSVGVDAKMKPTKSTVIKKDSSMSRQFAPYTLPQQERRTSSLLNNHVRNLSQSEKFMEPKACFNKDFVRSKKMDPIEASFINLSSTIQNRLQNSHQNKKENCNPDQIFGNFVSAELRRMSENRKSKIKCKIMQILYDDE